MSSQQNIFRRFIHSISASPMRQGTVRKRKWASYENLILHIHPKRVPLEALAFKRTFGLGGMCAVLFLLLASSGFLLLLVYEPFPEKAYQSMLDMQSNFLFGALVRNIHYWSANGLIVISFLHMLRVFFTGAFHGARQFNWVIGIMLFTVIILAGFTGYLLPWDQLAYWAVTISTGMAEYIPVIGPEIQRLIRGGDQTGSATLRFFFTFHTTILPAAFILLSAFHFWRVRKAGGIAISYRPDDVDQKQPEMADTIPSLAIREATAALVLVAAILVISALADAPLTGMANPGLSPNPAKAPWYFLGLQELLLHFHPVFAVFIIPVLFFLMTILLPYLPYESAGNGTWFFSTAGRKTGVAAATAAFVITPCAVTLDEFFIKTPNFTAGLPGIITTVIIPAFFLFFAAAFFRTAMKKKKNTVRNETVQAVFILFAVSFVLLTATGIWFRGEGMALVLP